MTDLKHVVAKEDTDRMIASNKVDGTAVYDRTSEKLGSIYNFMVNKRSGSGEYAVLQFGGLFGIGSDFYPLPWKKLTYSTEHGGYIVDVDRAVLDDAPRYGDP